MINRISRALAALVIVLGIGIAAPPSQAAPASKADPAKGSPIVDQKTHKVIGDLGNHKASKSPCGGVCRQYLESIQFIGTGSPGTGASAVKLATSQHNTYRSSNSYHTLWEVSAQGVSSNGTDGNIVEIGWRKTGTTTGQAGCSSTTNPCLFLYAWVNGVGQGYGSDAGSNYVDNPNEPVDNTTPLAVTAGGASPTVFYEYGARHMTTPPSWCTTTPGVGAWVMTQQNVGATRDIACYKDTLWTSQGETFTEIHLTQAFNEIAGTDSNPCTDMGSGVFGVSTTPSAAQWVKNYTLTGATASWAVADVHASPSTLSPTAFRINRNSSTETRNGGPGYNGLGGTSTGTVGSC